MGDDEAAFKVALGRLRNAPKTQYDALVAASGRMTVAIGAMKAMRGLDQAALDTLKTQLASAKARRDREDRVLADLKARLVAATADRNRLEAIPKDTSADDFSAALGVTTKEIDDNNKNLADLTAKITDLESGLKT